MNAEPQDMVFRDKAKVVFAFETTAKRSAQVIQALRLIAPDVLCTDIAVSSDDKHPELEYTSKDEIDQFLEDLNWGEY